MQPEGAFFLFLGLRKNYLFWATKDHFFQKRLLDVSSSRQIVLYLKKANRRRFLVRENIKRVESFSLE